MFIPTFNLPNWVGFLARLTVCGSASAHEPTDSACETLDQDTPGEPASVEPISETANGPEDGPIMLGLEIIGTFVYTVFWKLINASRPYFGMRDECNQTHSVNGRDLHKTEPPSWTNDRRTEMTHAMEFRFHTSMFRQQVPDVVHEDDRNAVKKVVGTRFDEDLMKRVSYLVSMCIYKGCAELSKLKPEYASMGRILIEPPRTCDATYWLHILQGQMNRYMMRPVKILPSTRGQFHLIVHMPTVELLPCEPCEIPQEFVTKIQTDLNVDEFDACMADLIEKTRNHRVDFELWQLLREKCGMLERVPEKRLLEELAKLVKHEFVTSLSLDTNLSSTMYRLPFDAETYCIVKNAAKRARKATCHEWVRFPSKDKRDAKDRRKRRIKHRVDQIARVGIQVIMEDDNAMLDAIKLWTLMQAPHSNHALWIVIRYMLHADPYKYLVISHWQSIADNIDFKRLIDRATTPHDFSHAVLAMLKVIDKIHRTNMRQIADPTWYAQGQLGP